MSGDWIVRGWDPFRPRNTVWLDSLSEPTRHRPRAAEMSHETATTTAALLSASRHLGLRWTIELNDRSRP